MIEVRRLLAVVSILALGAGVVACGSDSDSGGSDAAAELEGKTWKLLNIASQGAATSLPNTIDAPTLTFENGEVRVFNGCNTGTGKAEIGETSISFKPIAVTKKGCAGLAGEIEGYVMPVLGGKTEYEITEEGSLVLEGKQVNLVFVEA